MTASPPPSADWLPYARQDWARVLLLLREHDPAGAGIHLQQSVEKYLKGWLLDQGWALRRTHEVHRLLDDASGYDGRLRISRPLCVRLSSYYLVERYPPMNLAGPGEAQIATDLAEARQLIQMLFPNENL
jgi:HEPN domain-containing protein